jgi:ribose transport system permease protein
VGFVIVGLLQVYKHTTLGTGTDVGLSWGIPNSLLVFVPLALLIGLGLKYSGCGRVLYAIGDNEHAARLAGVRVGPVLVVLYVISALIAGIGGLVYVGLIQSSTEAITGGLLLPSVAAAVIGGTSIFGGLGGYAGTVVGALILQVMIVLLTVLHMPEGTRRIIFGLIVLAVAAAYIRVTGERRET